MATFPVPPTLGSFPGAGFHQYLGQGTMVCLDCPGKGLWRTAGPQAASTMVAIARHVPPPGPRASLLALSVRSSCSGTVGGPPLSDDLKVSTSSPRSFQNTQRCWRCGQMNRVLCPLAVSLRPPGPPRTGHATGPSAGERRPWAPSPACESQAAVWRAVIRPGDGRLYTPSLPPCVGPVTGAPSGQATCPLPQPAHLQASQGSLRARPPCPSSASPSPTPAHVGDGAEQTLSRGQGPSVWFQGKHLDRAA